MVAGKGKHRQMGEVWLAPPQPTTADRSDYTVILDRLPVGAQQYHIIYKGSLRMKQIVFALIVVAALAAGAAPSVLANGHGAATPVEAVTILARGTTPQGPVRAGCSSIQRTYRDCPVTDRMLQRLEQGSQAAFGEPVSRGSGQDLNSGVRVTEIDNTGDVALVNAGMESGLPTVTLTFVVRNQGGQWLVDDSYCAGQPETTIYSGPVPIPPCGASPTPMPNTGAGDFLGRVWLLALSGIGVFVLGLALRRRARMVG